MIEKHYKDKGQFLSEISKLIDEHCTTIQSKFLKDKEFFHTYTYFTCTTKAGETIKLYLNE